MVTIRITNTSSNALPSYATAQSAGLDLRADLSSPVILAPGERALIRTGLRIELPEGTEAQVRPRSGLALEHGITVLNSPGTIDADYRGEIGVLLINLGQQAHVIHPGERVAQLIIARYERATFVECTDLQGTVRGQGGFGHTGNN